MRKRMMSLLVTTLCSGSVSAQVTLERLMNPRAEPHNWLSYSGDYAAWRYSTLDQINTDNVKQLAAQWAFQSKERSTFKVTPLVIDGVMYLTMSPMQAIALDARTGRVIWHYARVPSRLPACCGALNRGLAASGDKLFWATVDAHVIALDMKTGNVVWGIQAIDNRTGYNFTAAPLVVRDKVIVGVAGGELGVRGFIDAYDAHTGMRAWRFYTIPGPGEPGHESWSGDSWTTGGAPAWITGAYDPELNLIFWPTGNPSPSNYGEDRKGDNLYSNSMLALDPDSGKLKWHYQFTPHDVRDWDATQIPVLLDLDFGGQTRKVLVQANRNGFFYVLDRTNGRLILAKPFARVTWAKEIGPDGRPVVVPGTDPTPEGTFACPGGGGATNFMSPSYSPQTGLFYVLAQERCDIVSSSPVAYQAGRMFVGSTNVTASGEKQWSALRALDPRTGELKWEFKYPAIGYGGALTTAGGVVFAGDPDGNFIGLDARTGKHLWHFPTGHHIKASPITYAVNGKQYVAIASGGVLFAFALPDNHKAPAPKP